MQLSDYGLWVHLYKHSPKFKSIPLNTDRLKSLSLDKEFSLKKEDDFLIEIAYNAFAKVFCHKYLSEITIKPMYGERTVYIDLKRRQYQDQDILQIILEAIWRNNVQVLKQDYNGFDKFYNEIKMFNARVLELLNSIPEIANEN